MNFMEAPLKAGHEMPISLDPERYQAVTDLDESQERPVTEVVREVLDLGLQQVKRRKQRKIQALSELDALRRQLESRVGIYPGPPIAEVRVERARQVAAVRNLISRPARQGLGRAGSIEAELLDEKSGMDRVSEVSGSSPRLRTGID